MKTTWTLQKEGKDILTKDVEKKAIDNLKGVGFKRKDIHTLDFYFNSEDGIVYYVADCGASGVIQGKVI